MAAISIEHLTKSFRGLRAVDDLHFEVGEGTITGFLGRNGAGKTTTMRVLLGLTAPSGGRALVHGRPMADLAEPARTVGAVLDPGFHPGRTTRNHLRAAALAARTPMSRVDDVLAAVDLSDAADRRTAALSMGMRQRLALAGALLGDPGVLVLDEPTNGLDPDGVVWLRQLLRDLRAEGRTVLVSSHQLNEVARIADDIVIIDRGQLIRQSPTGELTVADGLRVRTSDPAAVCHALTRREIGFHLDDDVVETIGSNPEDVARAVAESGALVYEMSPVGRSLEDIFFTLTQTPQRSSQ